MGLLCDGKYSATFRACLSGNNFSASRMNSGDSRASNSAASSGARARSVRTNFSTSFSCLICSPNLQCCAPELIDGTGSLCPGARWPKRLDPEIFAFSGALSRPTQTNPSHCVGAYRRAVTSACRQENCRVAEIHRRFLGSASTSQPSGEVRSAMGPWPCSLGCAQPDSSRRERPRFNLGRW